MTDPHDPTPADGAQPSARPLDNRLRELLSEAMRYLGRYESALYVNNNPRERGERERVQKLIEDIDDALNAS